MQENITLNKATRPNTIEELATLEKLTESSNGESTFTYNNFNEDEEFWIVDVPKNISPLDLKNQVLRLSKKSNFEINGTKYCATSNKSKLNLTCIFKTKNGSNKYKAVNIKPTKVVTIRKKLKGIVKNDVPHEIATNMIFPDNIKSRHPFGVELFDK